MDRREKVLAGLDLKNTVGMEIGPLYSPLVTRADGRIIYVDHADTAALREKYKPNPQVNVDQIVIVDHVWSGNTLSQAIDGQKVDYVVASHVVEHVPDLITWLYQIGAVLKPNGSVRLVVPDKRFTFDLLREESRISDVLGAYVVQAKIPPPHAILDFLLNARYDILPSDIWLGGKPTGRQGHSFEEAMAVACDTLRSGNYHDVHCWVFTPASFARICEVLVERDLMKMECARFFDTARGKLEFIVHMRPFTDKKTAMESWNCMARKARRFRPLPVSLAFLGSSLRRLKRALNSS
jgi:Methyltransferase domain